MFYLFAMVLEFQQDVCEVDLFPIHLSRCSVNLLFSGKFFPLIWVFHLFYFYFFPIFSFWNILYVENFEYSSYIVLTFFPPQILCSYKVHCGKISWPHLPCLFFSCAYDRSATEYLDNNPFHLLDFFLILFHNNLFFLCFSVLTFEEKIRLVFVKRVLSFKVSFHLLD